MGRSRYKFLDNQPHFLTCTIVNWLPIFTNPNRVAIVLDSLDFLQSQQRLHLHGYVIMENHLHLIASGENLSKEIGCFKSYTARSIIDRLMENHNYALLKQLKEHKQPYRTDQEHQLWQEGSHPQAILNAAMFNQKLDYIHNNPVRRGYVDDPTHWRYSSCRNYLGQQGLLAVELLEA